MSTRPPPQRSQRRYGLPPRAVRLTLVRHGAAVVIEPDQQPEDLLDGHHDPPLSPQGRQQAEAVCARLAGEAPSRIFTSNMRRTVETAAPLAAAKGVEPEVIDDLREVHLGEWEALYPHRVAERHPLLAEVVAEQRWDVIPGAEATAVFQARVAAAIDRVLAGCDPGDEAAVFAHGAVIAEICRSITGAGGLAFIFTENASITRVAHLGEGAWRLHVFNDFTHLD